MGGTNGLNRTYPVETARSNAFDPEHAFKVGLTSGREARQSGHWPKAWVAHMTDRFLSKLRTRQFGPKQILPVVQELRFS